MTEKKQPTFMIYHEEYDENGDVTWKAELYSAECLQKPVYETHNNHKKPLFAIAYIAKYVKESSEYKQPTYQIYAGRFKKGSYNPDLTSD